MDSRTISFTRRLTVVLDRSVVPLVVLAATFGALMQATIVHAAASSAIERRAAEQVLALGGKVSVVVAGGKPVEVVDRARLPTGSFVVNKIDLVLNKQANDAAMELLDGLSDLRVLTIGGTAITDATLMRVRALRSLEQLLVASTQITDAGVVQLGAMPNLQVFYGNRTRLTDQALVALANCPKLRYVEMAITPVTDQGVKSLSRLPLAIVQFSETSLSDAGIEALAACPKLESLRINRTKITDRSIALLAKQAKLRFLEVKETAITDAAVDDLAAQKNLKTLDISATQISENGFRRLKSALPTCEIKWTAGVPTTPTEPDKPAGALLTAAEFRQQIVGQLDGWLQHGDFDKLDKLANELRQSKAQLENGASKLVQFYVALSQPEGKQSAKQWEARIERCDQWLGQYPKSIAARLVLARAWQQFAWFTRGHGWASEVSVGNAELYRQRMDRALAVWEEARDVASGDAEWCAVGVSMAADLGLSRDLVKQLCDKSIEIDPNNLRTLLEAVRYYLPRWQGGAGELEAFADYAAKLTEKQWGKTAYARVVLTTQESTGHRVFQEHAFSWPLVKQGFEDWNKRFPADQWRIQSFCRMACEARDRETAAPLFNQIGPRPDDTIWFNESYFRVCRRWAQKGFPTGDQQRLVDPISMELRALAATPDRDILVVADASTDVSLLDLKQGTAQKLGDAPQVATALGVDRRSSQVYFATLLKDVWQCDRKKGHCQQFCQSETPITDIVLLDKAQQLVTASQGSTIKFWKLEDGWMAGELKVKRDRLPCLAVSPSEELFAAGASDGSVFLWTTASREEKASWKAHEREVIAVAFSSDGKLLATADLGQTKLWEAGTHELVGKLDGPPGVSFLSFTPNGKLLVGATGVEATDKAGRVVVWDVADRKLVRQLSGHKAPVTGLVIANDGNSAITSSLDTSVRIWPIGQ